MNGDICWFAPPSARDWLIPPRPHVVGDALADFVAVVKTSWAHRSGLSARQLVAARQREKKEENGREIKKKHDQEERWKDREQKKREKGEVEEWRRNKKTQGRLDSLCMNTINYPDKNIPFG